MESNINPDFIKSVHDFVQKRLFQLEEKRKILFDANESPVSFTTVIRNIMHVVGDCKKPLANTTICIERILKDQMNLILYKSGDIAIKRGSDVIEPQDLLFLLRKNKVKMKRLLQYLSIKDLRELIPKTKTAKYMATIEKVSNPTNGKRLRTDLQFLTSIDESFCTIMQEDIPDPMLLKRNKRKWLMTMSMSDEEYTEFSTIAGSSFLPRGGTEEFLAWLMEDDVRGLIPTEFALEILNYFARETIAEIIDLVMLEREKNVDSENEKISDNIPEKDLPSQQPITVKEVEEVVSRFIPYSSNQSPLVKLYNLKATRIICM